MRKVAFICSGNICRSPSAEWILRTKARARGIPVAVVSMGTLNLLGKKPSRHALTALKEIDIDASDHSSQGLNLGILRATNDIFVMDVEHKVAVTKLDPALAPRIRFLGELDPADGKKTIDDPVNGTLDDMRVCRDRIVRAIDAYLDSLS